MPPKTLEEILLEQEQQKLLEAQLVTPGQGQSTEQQLMEAQMTAQAAPIVPEPPNQNPMSQIPVSQDQRNLSELDLAAQKLRQYNLNKDAEIEQLRKYMKDYSRLDQGVDLTPIAAWASGLTKNPYLFEAAKGLAPESDAKKVQNLIDQQGRLTQLAGDNSSAVQLLNMYREKEKDKYFAKKEAREEERLDLSRKREERIDRLLGEGQIQKYQKEIQGKAALDSALGTFEKYVGFDVNKFNPETNTVDGKKIDLPGVNVPLLGRVSFYDRRAREIDDSMARIFNVELKDRSGSAVTNPELDRLKGEFSSGLFQTEPEKIQAIADYKRLMKEELQRREAAFSPQVRDVYKQRLQDIKSKNPPQIKEWGGKKYQLQGDRWVEVN